MAISLRHSRRMRCAPRSRRLIVEPFEPRLLLNSAPNGSNHTVTMPQDGSYGFFPVEFGFSDFGDSPPNYFVAVKVTTLPTAGRLTYDGAPVAAGQFIPVGDLPSTLKFRFAPDPGTSGVPYTSFTFQVQDDGSTANGGANLDPVPKTMLIQVTPPNHAPAGTDKSITIFEDQRYTFSASDFGFSDPLDPIPDSLAAVRLTTLPASGGTLIFHGPPLTSPFTVPRSELGYSSLIFVPAANASASPLSTFTFQVQDDGGTANGGVDLDPSPNMITITVLPVNDAPSGADKVVTAIEDTPLILSPSDFSFSDARDTPPNSFRALKVTTLPAGGTLGLSGVAVSPGQFISTLDVTAGLLRFTPLLNFNGATSFTFQVQDDGGVANGGVDLDPTPNRLVIDVIRVCGAPGPSCGSGDRQVAALEDTHYVFLTADFPFSSDHGGYDLKAVKISTLPAAGTLTYKNLAVTAGQFIPAPDIAAGNLKFRPPTDASGAAYTSLQYQAQDDGGTANGRSDLDTSPTTLTINVAPVNDSPSGADQAVTTLEDTPYSFSASDFGLNDSLDVPPNGLLAVKITTLSTRGTLALAGNAVSSSQFVSAADIAAGKLTFRPEANANGTLYSSFTFQAQDNGGTAFGGVDLDPTPNTITINVTPVNDPPTGQDRFIRLDCGQRTLSIDDFGYSDPYDDPPNDPLSVKIVGLALPLSGVLKDNGAPVTVGQLIPLVDLSAGKLVYSPPLAGSTPATIDFQVQDSGGTANGGIDVDPTVHTISLMRLFQPGLPPSGMDRVITVLEDATYALQIENFPFVDANNDNLKAVRITTLPNAGVLKDSGMAVTAGQYISIFDIAMRRLTYTPPANANGNALASFTFQVQDDGEIGCFGLDLDVTPNTFTINVLSVNDPPSGWDSTLRAEGSYYYSNFYYNTILPEDFGFSDPYDNPPDSFLGVVITTVPANGSLELDDQPLAPGSFVSLADLTARKLAYEPPLGAFGVPYTSFTFQVKDDGGAANGGSDLDPTPNTMKIDVRYWCGRPTWGLNSSVLAVEGRDYVFSLYDFELYSSDWGSLTIFSLPAVGILRDNGIPVRARQVVPAADIAMGRLTFTPPSSAGDMLVTSFEAATDGDGCIWYLTEGTVAIGVVPVNQPPSFVNGADQNVTDEGGPQSISDWASAISPGRPSETWQTLHFNIVANTNPSIFASPPLIDAAGKLTFAPQPNTSGTAQLTVVLVDDGGTANGGSDTSPPQTFNIAVTKPHLWYNVAHPTDVKPDGSVVAGDAIEIINYINAFGSGDIPNGAAAEPPYLDVTGDNKIGAIDAVEVINHINAFGPGGEGEGAAVSGAALEMSQMDLLNLLAMDVAGQPRRRNR
jgi:Dockerin type I domain/Bacterial Ig domain/Bacterial cadherin-like domain